MAYEIPLFKVGVLPSNIDMSTEASWQFTGVDVVVASGTVQGTGTGGAAVGSIASTGLPGLGVVQNNPQIGEAAEVTTHGISKAVAGGTIAIDNLLMWSVSGGIAKLVVATSTNYAVAKALESAVSGDVFTVFLRNYGKV